MQRRNIITRTEPHYSKCPMCGVSDSIYRSRSRNLLEKLLKSLRFVNLYRCHKCNWRGYRMTYTINIAVLQFLTFKNAALYIVLLVTCAVFVYAVIKTFIGKN